MDLLEGHFCGLEDSSEQGGRATREQAATRPTPAAKTRGVNITGPMPKKASFRKLRATLATCAAREPELARDSQVTELEEPTLATARAGPVARRRREEMRL